MPPVCVSLWAGVGLDPGLHTPHSFRIGAAATAASSVPAGTLQAKDGGCTGRYFTMGIRPPLFPGLRRTRKSGSAYNLISEISPRLLRTQPRWLPSASWASSDTYLLSRVVMVTGYTDNTSHTSMSVQCGFKSLPSVSACSINHSGLY